MASVCTSLLLKDNQFLPRPIWAYEDFADGTITTTSVTLTDNENGDSAKFNITDIVGSSALILQQNGQYVNSNSLFSTIVSVTAHSGDSITLSGVPKSGTETRIWYKIIATSFPKNYDQPPLVVQANLFKVLDNVLLTQDELDDTITTTDNVWSASKIASEITSAITTLDHEDLVGLQGGNGTDEFYHITAAEHTALTGLSADRLVASDSSGNLASVPDLTAWIAGTTNQVIVTDNADGTVTLSTPQDIDSSAIMALAGLTITGASDTTHLKVIGNSTQNTTIFEVEDDSNNSLFNVDQFGTVNISEGFLRVESTDGTVFSLKDNSGSSTTNDFEILSGSSVLPDEAVVIGVGNSNTDTTAHLIFGRIGTLGDGTTIDQIDIFADDVDFSGNVDVGGTANIDGILDVNNSFRVNGSSDSVQFRLKGHTTQTSDILKIIDSASTELLSVDNSGNLEISGNLGVGITPVSVGHFYQNNSDTGTSAGVTIEQAGAGDADLQFLRTGSQRYVIGIDGDDDVLKISRSADVGTEVSFAISPAGNVGLATGQTDEKVNISLANDERVYLNHNNVADPALRQVYQGMILASGTFTTTNKFAPALQWGSRDVNFTTSNPKFLAGIVGRATENYDADTDSGMALDFMTTPNNAGTAPIPSVVMSIDQDGNVIIGSLTLNEDSFSSYCVTGTGTDIPAAPTVQDLSTEQVANANFSLASDTVTVDLAGTYQISYAIQIDEDGTTGGVRGRTTAYVTNGGTPITQSYNSTYVREASGGGGVSNSFIETLSAADTLQLFTDQDGTATPDMSAERTQLSILKIA